MNPLTIHFPANHPTAAGHFPGRPIIPGAVLLDAVLNGVAEVAGGRARLIKSAKFFSPVTPGTSIQVHWQCPSPGTVKFEIRPAEGNSLVASGSFEITTV